jgi:hypothetical protein
MTGSTKKVYNYNYWGKQFFNWFNPYCEGHAGDKVPKNVEKGIGWQSWG